MADTPNSYRDPFWANLAAQTEAKAGLPAGLLVALLTKGERSNADQVSEAGAKTPFQITPTTRDLVLKRDGIDAYLSPENAAEVAAIVAKDGVNWAKRRTEDPAAINRLAAGYYHAGGDTKNWGPRTLAYMARVTGAPSEPAPTSKASFLENAFSKWMAQNPAQPAAKPAAEAAAADPLEQGFAAFLAEKAQPKGVDAIPTALGANTAPTPQAPAPGLIDKAIGTGEAALTALTGATGGALGMVGGTLAGAAGEIASGQLGTPAAANRIEQAASQGAQALTYAPRTASGQAQAEALGQGMQAILPAVAVAPSLNAAMAGLGPAAGVARTGAAAVLDKAATAVPEAARAVAGKVASVMPGTERAPTPGTLGSAGAAATDMATQRTQAASALPVPIKLTTGQSTRNFEQLRFEKETAKDPRQGAALRDFADEQTARILQNFDNMVDQTGAVAPDIVAANRSVVSALTQDAAKDKSAIRVAYKNAEKAGELEQPVTLNAVVQHLNESAPDAAVAPLLTTARARALQLGIATEDAAGQLVPQAVPLKTAERFRQAVGRATDYAPTNMRQAAIIKGAVDAGTEGAGGTLYATARTMRRQYAEKYENRAVIADLIQNRKGMADPKVAIDKVFTRSVLQGSPDDVKFLKTRLQSGGENGRQAWREVQGATLGHLREQATRGVTTDQRGNPVISPAGLERALQSLDKNGRLQIIFGKQGAQQLRDLNDIAKVINTVPPGAVNTSNTASVLLAALAESGVTGSLTGIPVPLMSGLRAIAVQVKDRRIQQRVQAALRNEELRQKAQKLPTQPAGKTIH